ncbi:hypothetical protein H5410_014793 [Solanum commersonii]|uniref:Uncharacterized protein n=1 Tax=Solanum commersonii TaxID=4109 RepID=A0A9J5ZRY4_SOLCO|nr:hypothetical protein H5410_014793 [Solanum commersonii]
MRNLGNTCFINVVVQFFIQIVMLLQLLRLIDHVSPCQSKDQFRIIHYFLSIFSVSYLRLSSFHVATYDNGFCVVCIIRELINILIFYGRLFVKSMKLVSQLRSISKPMTKDNIVKEAFGGLLVSKTPLVNILFTLLVYFSQFSARLLRTLKVYQPHWNLSLKLRKLSSLVKGARYQEIKNNGLVVQKVEKHVSFPLELDMFLHNNDINSVDSVQKDLVFTEQAYILFYANRGTPLFLDYIQIHRPFVCLVISTISNDASDEPTQMPELNNVKDKDSQALVDQVYCEDQLQDVEIKKDVELKDPFNRGSHGISVNKNKRKLED